MIKVISKNKKRLVRKQRAKDKVRGTKTKPRLMIYKSLKNIYVQLIDDEEQRTIFAFSTLNKEYFGSIKNKKNKEAAKKIGELIAEKLLGNGIKNIVFDRNGYRYHGKIKLLADAAREKGLIF